MKEISGNIENVDSGKQLAPEKGMSDWAEIKDIPMPGQIEKSPEPELKAQSECVKFDDKDIPSREPGTMKLPEPVIDGRVFSNGFDDSDIPERDGIYKAPEPSIVMRSEDESAERKEMEATVSNDNLYPVDEFQIDTGEGIELSDLSKEGGNKLDNIGIVSKENSNTIIEHKTISETRMPENNGEWDGERGNSTWYPDRDYTPPEMSRNPKDNPYSNPDNLSWGELLDNYGIDGIEFRNGFPVFDEVSRGTVEIEDFETGGTDAKARNFKKADISMAEQKGCSPEEVEKWRKENNYTWHECEDKRTMQKVPNEVHANIPHEGGRSQK